MSISDFFEDDDESFPLSFIEVIGDHAITEGIRKAIVWASIQKFITDDESLELVDNEEFTDSEKKLSSAIMFHGPYENLDEAMEESKQRVGVLVAPKHLWTDESEFVYIAVLAN